jgi:uncharacterized SAM-binding protein YcdF (DUF218 family)
MGKAVRTAGRLKKALLALLLAGLLCFGVLEALVLTGEHSELKAQPDAVIILGANLWGEAPSPALRNRLDAALVYLEELDREGCQPLIVVSGGQGDDEVMSEAACMAAYLEAAGTAPERMILEDQSTNTAENLRNAKALLEGTEISSVTVVSNDFHLTRVRLLMGRLLPDWQCSTLSAPMPDTRAAVYSTLREGLALVKSYFLDR